MDGAMLLRSEGFHTFMCHEADALGSMLPNAGRRTLEGQDHGQADEALVPALTAFFLS